MPFRVLNYEERGQGTPVVLLHGFPFDHTIWRHQIEDVSKEARVLAPDLSGFGESESLGDAEPTVEDYVDELVLWAGEIGLERFVLVGHSMGGYIAFAFARLYPERVAALGLVCTRSGPDSEEARQNRYASITQVWDRGPQAVAESMLPRLFSPETTEKKPELVEEVRQVMLRQRPAGLVGALEAMASRPDSTHLLERIRVPTLIVAGVDDRIIPAEDIDLMAAMIPGARLERIPGAGHMPMLERPDKLSPMLADLARGARKEPGIPRPPSKEETEGPRHRS